VTAPAQPQGHPEVVSERIEGSRPDWLSNATSADHKVIGRMYIAGALSFCAAAVTLLVLMRIQLIVPDGTLLRPEIFDRMLSTYGATALVLFAVPLLIGLIAYVVPLQIGARGIALPRLASLSFWLYVAGGVALFASFLYRPSEAGTTAQPPLSVEPFTAGSDGVDAWIIGVGLATLGFVLFAICLVATMHGSRAPGMVWRRVPLFSWAATVGSWLLLVVGPVMLAALTMLFVDRHFDGVFFDPGDGGKPTLYQHLSWIYFTGMYVFVVLGAFGTISEILPTFTRQPQFAHRTIAFSLAAFAVLATLAWMQNMYTAAIPRGFLYFTMLMALSAAIPVGLILFNWIATISGGRPQVKLPMLYALGAIVLTTIGLAGEWAQSVIPVAWQTTDTGVAWGDTHFALIGAGVLGGFAGLYYWFPKISGRLMGSSLGRASFWAILVGAIVMILPIQLAGLEGMPTDVYKYFGDTGISGLNLIASLGSFLLAIGIILTLVNAAASYNNGARVGHDPWGASTLEWYALSPPPAHNFDRVPDVRSNEPLLDIRDAIHRRATRWTPPPARRPDDEPEPVAVATSGEEVEVAESDEAGVGTTDDRAAARPAGDDGDPVA
jgi:cytochrome c oxidase subunit I